MYDDAVDDAVIALCAAIAAQDTGSARQALDILYKSGEIARTNGEERLTEDHVIRLVKDSSRAKSNTGCVS